MAKRHLFMLEKQSIIHHPQNTIAIKNPLAGIRFCKKNYADYQYERIVFEDVTIAMTQKPKHSLGVDGIISKGAFISNQDDGSLDVGLCFLNSINQDRVSQKIRSVPKGEEVEITLVTTDYGAFYIKGTVIEHFADNEYILTSDSTN